MSSNADFFLKKHMGEDFLQSLEKFDLWKQGTKSVTDHEEIKTALKIVPRVLMAFLIRSLAPMKVGEHADLVLNVANRPDSIGPDMLKIDKHERDVYSGEIISDNKKIAEFKFRSIPGVGLVIMSTFELYQIEDLEQQPEVPKPGFNDIIRIVQQEIEQRLAMHDLVGKVVDKKLSERDAIQQLILAKITEEQKNKKIEEVREVHENSTPQEDPYFRGMTNGMAVAQSVVTGEEPKLVEAPKKGSPLKKFLDDRTKKLKKNEYPVQLVKGETVRCPDCGNALIDGHVFTGCVCLGDDMDKKLYIKKTENGVKVRFGKGWDPENIEMLLEVLRGKSE